MKTFVKIISFFPLWFIYGLVDVLVFPIVYHIVRYRRRYARKNLRNSFPDKSWWEIKMLERKHYRYFCDLILEIIWGYGASRDEMSKRVHFLHLKEYAHISRQYGGSICMLGHMGNWEWMAEMGHRLEQYEVSSVHIYRQLRSAKMDQILLDIRSKRGSEFIEKKQVLRQMVARRKREWPSAYGFVADQKPSPSVTHYYWTHFLHQQTPFLDGSEQLAKKFSYPVFYAYIRRPKRGCYVIDMQLVNDKPQASQPYEMTELFARLLERNIIEQPEIWLWTHNRWKYQYTEDKDILKSKL